MARKPHTTPRDIKLAFIKFTCFLYRLSNRSEARSNGKYHQWTNLHIVQAGLITGKGTGKTVPLQAWSGPVGLQEVKVPRLRDNVKVKQSRYRPGVAP